jgi:two-component system nitrate/nitrite response regulator NarL
VKVLLVDDHALFRAGMRMLLASLGEGATVLEASTADEALTLLDANHDIDVCLLDLSLKGDSSLAPLQRIKEAAPTVAVVIVSAAEDNATVRACLDAGAMSFIPKSLGPDVLTQALQHVLAGTIYLPEHVSEGMAAMPAAPALTPRQFEVLHALSRGLPTKLIARELGLSEHTVKEHITLVFQALGAKNRTEAVIKGSRLRLIEAGPR